MSTQLFFRIAASDYSTGNNDAALDGSTTSGWVPLQLALTRGSALEVTTALSQTGPTSGIEIALPGGRCVWYSPPLDADVTISGSITWNLWSAENNMGANAAINAQIEKIDGATGVITLIDKTARTTELATSVAVANFAETPAVGIACKRGDRLRVRVFGDDAGTMGGGFAFQLDYNGGTAAADGDSYLTLTENLTFASEPAGSQVFPTTDAALGETVSDTGYVAGGTYETVSRGFVAWVNPSNAAASDNSYATAANVTGTDYLVCRNLGLSIPVGAVVRRIDVSIEEQSTVGGGSLKAQLQDDTATLVGLIDGVGLGTGGDTLYELSYADNTWRPPVAWTPAKVNHANFGVRVWCQDATVETISIDQIKIRVWYQTEGAYKNQLAWTSRGSGVVSDVTNTFDGWTAPIQLWTSAAASAPVEWYTPRLAAFTLGGAVRCNLRALESAGGVHASVRAEIAVVNADGSSPTVWATGCAPAELGSAEAAVSFLISGDDLAVSAGQRLRVRVYLDDWSQQPMVSGFTASLYYAGTSGGASGDTYLTFTQALAAAAFGPPFTRNDLKNSNLMQTAEVGW